MFDWEEKLEVIPHDPGCYLMKDKRGNVVYVGKAKDLKNRVRSYFQPSGDQRTFVEALPHVLGDIDVIITESDKEAMILENTLIKQHQPRYNVKLKDDKNFRVHYRLYMDSMDEAGKKLFFKCHEMYEGFVKYIPLPPGTQKLSKG